MTTSEPSAAATGQPVPNGPRRPIVAPGCELGDRAADGADGADGVHEAHCRRAVAADADRDFADAEGVEHVELPGLECRPRPGQRHELQRHGVAAIRGGPARRGRSAARTDRAAAPQPCQCLP